MANSKRILLVMLIFSFCLFGCRQQKPAGQEEIPPKFAENSRSCGDGICDGPESTMNCPEDCGEPSGPAPGQHDDLQQPPDSSSLPVHFFYVIHTHTSDQFHPYANPEQTSIDTEIAENMLAAIDGITSVLDKYGAKASWQFLPATVKGFHQYQGDDNIIHQLLANGHEIGVHTHSLDDVQSSVQNLEQYCGINPQVTSGFLAQISNISPGESKAAMSIAIDIQVKQGLSVGTANLSPGGEKNPLASACQEVLGEGNDMWPQTGNLMFPWRPDYAHQDPCSHNPDGEMLLIDHVSIDWVILPDEATPADVLDSRYFNLLADKFRAALDYMAENSPGRTASWGFVTHITEYAEGGNGQHPPSQESLLALDNFLALVDSYQNLGLVVYSTPAQIADLVDKETN